MSKARTRAAPQRIQCFALTEIPIISHPQGISICELLENIKLIIKRYLLKKYYFFQIEKSKCFLFKKKLTDMQIRHGKN